MNRCFYMDEDAQSYAGTAKEVEILKNYVKDKIYSNLNNTQITDKPYPLKKDILMFIDIHTHSSQKGIFIFAPHGPIQDQHKIRYFPQILDEVSPYFRLQSCKFQNEKSKKHCARLAFFRDLKIDQSFTIEISSYGYLDKVNNKTVQLQEKDLFIFGKHIIQGIAKLC